MSQRTHIRGAETDMSGVKDRFGGIDTPAALLGMFAALGVLVLLSSLIAAGAGGLAYQLNAIDLEGNVQQIEVIGAVVAALVVFLSFLAGGWAAGRMARYDGGMNGLGAGLWMILLVALFAALGAWVGQEYNAFQRAGLPDWFSQFRGEDLTTMAIISGVVSVALVLGGGYLGGKMGEAYHRKVDAALADRAAASTPRTN